MKSKLEYDICVITSTHPANDTRIYVKEIQAMLDAGYRVLYYTNRIGQEITNPKSDNPHILHPNLKVTYNENYDMYNRKRRFLRSLGMFLWINKKCHVYHFHDPDLVICGSLLKIAGKKVIYDVHENYIDNFSEKPYLSKIARSFLSFAYKKTENFLCKRYDAIIAATPSIKSSYDKRGFKKVRVIYNYPYLNELESSDPQGANNEENTFIYVGGITEIRGITNVVNSLVTANKSERVKLILAGPIFPDAYREELESLPGWRYVDYIGIISRTRMAKELSKAKCGICILKPMKDYIESLPTKIFEYMSAGLPVLCSDFPLWKEIVLDSKVGYVCDSEDNNSIAESMVTIARMDSEKLESMGIRGKDMIKSRYSWENEEKKLLNLYKELMQ